MIVKFKDLFTHKLTITYSRELGFSKQIRKKDDSEVIDDLIFSVTLMALVMLFSLLV